MSLPDDLALAHELADAADAHTLARFRAVDLRVESKPDLTPVSDADRAVEQAIRSTLATRRPSDAVLGEEDGETGTGPRRWVVDPVDGTKNFVRGVPVSGIKGVTGHALGAAGALEAASVLLSFVHRELPPTMGTTDVDPSLEVDVVLEPRAWEPGPTVSNSFGFGGHNGCLVLGPA